jgi:hypothetical protein
MIAALERKNKRLAKTRAIMLEHDPEKHALGLDPRVGARFRKIMLNQNAGATIDSI